MEEKDVAYVLKTNLYDLVPQMETSVISTELLGEAFEPEQKFEQPDGTPIIFNQDYFGEKRMLNPMPGPFASKAQEIVL